MTKRPEYEYVRADSVRNWRLTTFIGADERAIAFEAEATEGFRDEAEKTRAELKEERAGRQKEVMVLEIEAIALAELRRMCVNGDGIVAVVN